MRAITFQYYPEGVSLLTNGAVVCDSVQTTNFVEHAIASYLGQALVSSKVIRLMPFDFKGMKIHKSKKPRTRKGGTGKKVRNDADASN